MALLFFMSVFTCKSTLTESPNLSWLSWILSFGSSAQANPPQKSFLSLPLCAHIKQGVKHWALEVLPGELVNFEQLLPTRLDVIMLNESKPGPPIQQTETYVKRASMRKQNKLCTHTVLAAMQPHIIWWVMTVKQVRWHHSTCRWREWPCPDPSPPPEPLSEVGPSGLLLELPCSHPPSISHPDRSP